MTIIGNGQVSLNHVLQKTGTNFRALVSRVSASEGLNVGSIRAGRTASAGNANSADGKLSLSGAMLVAGAHLKVFSHGALSIAGVDERVDGIDNTLKAVFQGADVNIESGGALRLLDADLYATSGHLQIASLRGSADIQTGGATKVTLKAAKNIALHGQENLTLSGAHANAGGHFTALSKVGMLTGTNTNVVAEGVISFASKQGQSHTLGTYVGGALSAFDQGVNLALTTTSMTANASASTAGNFAGQLSLESGGAMSISADSRLRAGHDLSIITGAGDITLGQSQTGSGLSLAFEQLYAQEGANRKTRDLTVIARSGSLVVNGYYSAVPLARDITLVGANVSFRSSPSTSAYLSVERALNIMATTGHVELAASLDITKGDWFSVSYVMGLELLSSGSVAIQAMGDVKMASARISSKGATSIKAGGNITAVGLLNETYYAMAHAPVEASQWSQDTSIRGDSGVTLDALGGSILIQSGHLESTAGTVRLQARDNITLEPGQFHNMMSRTSTSVSETWYGKKKVKTTTEHNESLMVSPTFIDGKEVEILAGGNLNSYAAQIRSGGNLKIAVGGDANYYGVHNQIHYEKETKTRSSFFGVKYGSSTDTITRRELYGKPAVLISKNNISSYSGGDQLLQGTMVQYGGTADFRVGYGPEARAGAVIRLEGLKDTVIQSRTREDNYTVWQKQSGSGSTIETLTLPTFSGPTKPVFSGPVLAQIPAGDFKTQIQALSQQPGMAYLADLAQRTDVNWQPVKLAYDQWSYKQEGLTPAGAALLSVAVAWATGGMGAELLGINGGFAGAAANAAFMSLSSQAAITLVNNKGDIGKTLKDMGSSEVVKATVAAAITAGVLDKIGGTQMMKELASKGGLSDKLTIGLINSSGRALTNVAINGGDLTDVFKQAILGAAVDTLHGHVASKIQLLEADYLAHKLAHALAGCVAGAAAQGTCRDGAIGGAVGEMVAELFKSKVPAWNASDAEWESFDALVRNTGKLVAGAVSAYAGGNAQTAITTAEVAIDNNSRISLRMHAMQQQVSGQQLWINMRVLSLQNAVRSHGGSVPGNLTTPGARVNYTQADITRLETQLRSLSPHHELIYSQPSVNLSPLPASYVNMRYSVNMQNVSTSSSVNAFGFNRDGVAFFRELLRTNPQLFSPRNIERINNREAPQVDAQWIQHNPTHQAFLNSPLVHHHWMQGNVAVAIPAPIHQQWSRTFHPYR